MKKLFTLIALAGAFALAGCDDTNGTEEDNNGTPTVITLKEGTNKDQAVLATATEVSVTFTIDGNWKSAIIETTPKETRANITQPLPAITWAEIEGASGNKVETSGTAGTHTIKVKLQANTETTARAIQLRIIAGTESQEALRFTQLGAGQSIEPTTKQVASIKLTETTNGETSEVTQTDFNYDAQGRVSYIVRYDPDVSGTGMGYKFAYEEGKLTITAGNPSLPDGTDYIVKLDANGNAQTIYNEDTDYNNQISITYQDGLLKHMVNDSQTYSDWNFVWADGNLARIWFGETDSGSGEAYQYTGYSNTGTNIDLNFFINGIDGPGWQSYVVTEVLGYTGLLGARSKNLTGTYNVGFGAEATDPDLPYYYEYDNGIDPVKYVVDNDGYITEASITYYSKKYKVMKEGGQKTLESEYDYKDVFTVTYKN